MYISLPFKLPSDPHGRVEPEVFVAPPSSDFPLRILFAEDDEINLKADKKLLEKLGHTVVTAMDGQEALKLLAEQDFDLILMDIQMPVMDGLEATRRIRASGKSYARIPIIAMTSYAMAGDRERFLAASMDGYISKPVNMKELKETIERVMSKEKPQ